MNDTAAFTAEVALEQNTPGDLQITGFQISPNEILAQIKEIIGENFTIHQVSELEDFAAFIKKKRAENPAENMNFMQNFSKVNICTVCLRPITKLWQMIAIKI